MNITAPPTITPERIKATRQRLGLTQTEFAARLGLAANRESVCRLEKGRRRPVGPLLELLLREERYSLAVAPAEKIQNNSAQTGESC